MSPLDLTYVIAKLVFLWLCCFCFYTAADLEINQWEEGLNLHGDKIGRRFFQMTPSGRKAGMSPPILLFVLGCYSVVFLLCFLTAVSVTDSHPFIIIFRNVCSPTSLALFITLIIVAWCDSTAPFASLLLAQSRSIREFHKARQPITGAAGGTQGADSPRRYLYLALLPLALSPWRTVLCPVPNSWQYVNFVLPYLLNGSSGEL